MLKCRWCGEKYCEADNFDRAENGFWCDTCDGFTHYREEDGNRHRMLLLLERTGEREYNIPGAGELPPVHLRKRVSPLRYPGGKSKLIDFLYGQLLSGFTDTFVEVFAGGASLGLSLLDAGCIRRLILNDYDPMVYAFWNVCLTDPETLCHRIDEKVPSIEDFWAAKKVLAESHAGYQHEQENLAWSFLLLNRTAFSGIVLANPMGGKGEDTKKFLSRWNPEALKQRIRRVAELAPHIQIYNKDCNAFLEEEAYWLPGCTLFVDPPYVEAGKALYGSAFTMADHERLASLLESLYTGMDGPDIIITYDDHPAIRGMYPLAEQKVVGRTYSIAN